MIKNSCFECDSFDYNQCNRFGYYFKDLVAKKTTCKKYKERENNKERVLAIIALDQLIEAIPEILEYAVWLERIRYYLETE